ncbi:hypothetical protein ASC66_01225 [Leifsonia sp. Root4]|uniref:phage portal protein n=1 Tax=Leifsonia sp. Root4 TaxID=1736525 RepID=UPI0006F9C13E|nr:phage portal protein [Leifsonia sp. Root4]KQW07650.1 hypothetical protein ASC66_01225 [Leifsonia sp. Root4]
MKLAIVPRFAAGLWDSNELSQQEKQEATVLAMRMGRFAPMNRERTLWYDAKHTVEHLGIAVPQQLEEVAPVLGWPARSVDDLAERTTLDGFVTPGDTWASSGLDAVWSDNRLPLLASMVHTSAYKYAVSFAGAIRGGNDEPDVLTPAYSATTSTGRWDPIRGRLSSFLTITGKNTFGLVTGFALFTPEAMIKCTHVDGKWRVDRRVHNVGRVPVVPFVHNPSVEWEFGTSRITRPVISITQRAVRTLLRMEVSAEFYSSPQRAVLGADEGDFVDSATGQMKTGWEVTIGKLLALSRDDEGNIPTVQQFQQATMQPHMDMIRSDAALFSGETGIPVDTLGVIHDNPSSASGVDARYKKLNAGAEKAIKGFEGSWADLMRLAVMVRDDDARAADDLSQMSANFRRPHEPTVGEASDAMVKQVAAIPWLAESTVTLRRLGYTKAEIDELLSDKRRAQAGTLVSSLRQTAEAAAADPAVAAVAVARGGE